MLPYADDDFLCLLYPICQRARKGYLESNQPNRTGRVAIFEAEALGLESRFMLRLVRIESTG